MKKLHIVSLTFLILVVAAPITAGAMAQQKTESKPPSERGIQPRKVSCTDMLNPPALSLATVPTPQPIAKGPLKNDVVLFGFVRDAKDNSPLQNATINLYFLGENNYGKRNYRVTSDARGRYEFRQKRDGPIISGSYELWAQAYIPPRGAIVHDLYVLPRVVLNSTKTSQLDIMIINKTMTKPATGAILYGHVFDKITEEPIPDAWVYPYFPNAPPSLRLSANADGFYQFVVTDTLASLYNGKNIAYIHAFKHDPFVLKYQTEFHCFEPDAKGPQEINFYLAPKNK